MLAAAAALLAVAILATPAQARPPECPEPPGGDNLIIGTPAGESIDGDDLEEFEQRDTIFGAAGDDFLRGLFGNDCVVGSLDQDTVKGNEGIDRLFGSEGRDQLDGGDGDDLMSGGPEPDTLLGDENADRMQGDEGADTLQGQRGPDSLVGNSGDDLLAGGDGDDRLDDSLEFSADPGSNRFFGNEDDDKINAANGIRDEQIDCGPGKDDKALVDRNDPRARHCEKVKTVK